MPSRVITRDHTWILAAAAAGRPCRRLGPCRRPWHVSISSESADESAESANCATWQVLKVRPVCLRRRPCRGQREQLQPVLAALAVLAARVLIALEQGLVALLVGQRGVGGASIDDRPLQHPHRSGSRRGKCDHPGLADVAALAIQMFGLKPSRASPTMLCVSVEHASHRRPCSCSVVCLHRVCEAGT